MAADIDDELRLAALHLVLHGEYKQRRVAAAVGVTEGAVRKWKRDEGLRDRYPTWASLHTLEQAEAIVAAKGDPQGPPPPHPKRAGAGKAKRASTKRERPKAPPKPVEQPPWPTQAPADPKPPPTPAPVPPRPAAATYEDDLGLGVDPPTIAAIRPQAQRFVSDWLEGAGMPGRGCADLIAGLEREYFTGATDEDAFRAVGIPLEVLSKWREDKGRHSRALWAILDRASARFASMVRQDILGSRGAGQKVRLLAALDARYGAGKQSGGEAQAQSMEPPHADATAAELLEPVRFLLLRAARDAGVDEGAVRVAFDRAREMLDPKAKERAA